MASLPIFQSQDKDFMLHQTSWKAAITPILNNELNQGILLVDIELSVGSNTINHLLGRKQIGWIIADTDAGSTIYRSGPLNDKTLILTASAPCTCAIWMF